jgi:beta-1,4-mannosyl-glycoprotein beta-1,4-N-acetylglucosaminyltransferase
MIIDCFPFFNELDVLEIRLNILDPFVDKFVLVEADKTQSFSPKPFFFEENKERFSKFLDKIVHVKMEDDLPREAWSLENLQRNYILKGLSKLSLKNSDIVAISDVDEIWNPLYLDDIKTSLLSKNFVSITMDYLVFFLNLETVDKNWTGTVFTSAKNFLQATPQGVRNIKDRLLTINSGGWHFGYQGGKEMVYNKYYSCVEPMNKTLIPPQEDFNNLFDLRIKDGGSFIYSDNIADESIKLKKYPIEKLPKYIKDNLDKYQHLILK